MTIHWFWTIFRKIFYSFTFTTKKPIYLHVVFFKMEQRSSLDTHQHWDCRHLVQCLNNLVINNASIRLSAVTKHIKQKHSIILVKRDISSFRFGCLAIVKQVACTQFNRYCRSQQEQCDRHTSVRNVESSSSASSSWNWPTKQVLCILHRFYVYCAITSDYEVKDCYIQ